MIYATPTLPDELYHHGIKGMKWGIRRYQNEDGSYTAAGRKRYGMNLDINDKSRKNIANIRLGEARRRLDVAKANSENGRNDYRVAQAQERVRAAKRIKRSVRGIDKGAKLAAKGQTITENGTKTAIIAGAASIAIGLGKMKGYTISDITRATANSIMKARYGTGKEKVKNILALAGAASIVGGAGGYYLKKANDNRYLRKYNNASWSGKATKKYIGGDEYQAVKERRNAEK